MKHRLVNMVVILSMLLSCLSLATATPVAADGSYPFTKLDSDGDGIPDQMEKDGWYNLAGGPFITDPNSVDTDRDGLTDSEEKLFNTNPLDPHSPGISIAYDNSFKTFEYFSTTDPAYLQIVQGGDRYLMTQAAVIRRGTTFRINGPSTATLTITGTNLTTLPQTPDPAHGGWIVSIPANGTAGTYTATLTDGSWSSSMPIYVIFELPADLSSDQVAAFLYDDDPANKKDEVAVFNQNPEWSYYGNNSSTPQPCPLADPNVPCSLWQYHYDFEYTQAFWTEQFTKAVFVDNAIKAINGYTNITDAAFAVGNWTDREFRTNYNNMKNSWSTAMYRWNDGTGITMSGGACESTSSVFTSILRSAGIAARPFALDYNKTAGHGESGEIGNQFQYDHSTMMWLDHMWKAERAYNGSEGAYYPFNSGTTGIAPLQNWAGYSGYYNDYYGDLIETVGPGWDFQNGSNGGGMVNTVWVNGGAPAAEFVAINRDFEWNSLKPLQITQSPNMQILNCQLWKGDGWAPSEWQNPPQSNPSGRGAALTYYLPAGIPDPTNPLENWPYDPKPVACSPSTPSGVCSAFLASWTPVCQPLSGSTNGTGQAAVDGSSTAVYPDSMAALIPAKEDVSINLGKIVGDYAVDTNGDNQFDKLIVKVEVTSSKAGEYKFDGFLRAGDKEFRSNNDTVKLAEGTQVVEVSFDGQLIGDNKVDGPYQIESLWTAQMDMPVAHVIVPDNMLAYQTFTYATTAYKANTFSVTAASFADNYSDVGVDSSNTGKVNNIVVNVPLNIQTPGNFIVQGDLYDAKGNYVGQSTWKGSDPNASLQFNVANTTAPYTLDHLYLFSDKGPMLDSRYYQAYVISDMAGKISGGNISLAVSDQGAGIDSVTPDPTSFSISTVDTNGDGKFDKLVAAVTVNVTVHGGSYRIEGLLEDSHGTPVAWSTSNTQSLVVGNGQHMTLEFDGKTLYDQMALTGAQSFKLVAVKIYSGNLSSGTLEAQVPVAITTPAYTRSQFQPSNPAQTYLSQDDLDTVSAQWNGAAPLWSLTQSTWHSWTTAWMANASGSANGALSLITPLDLTNYAAPWLRFTQAYQIPAGGSVALQARTNSGSWTTLKTYTGSTTSWSTDFVDLSAFAKKANVQIQFVAQSSTGGLRYYVDDIYLNAWSAVLSASFTYSPQPVLITVNTAFTATYVSNDPTLPVTYTWNFGDGSAPVVSSSPNVNHTFASSGSYSVQLTVRNPYDSAATTQTVLVTSLNQYHLTVNIAPSGGGTVAKSPDLPAYDPGTVVTLTPSPTPGYTFSAWSGACSGSGGCQVTMNSDKTVTATFNLVTYTLSVNSGSGGSVTKSPNQPTYHYGDIVQLSATPVTGWSFINWSGDLSGSANPASITISGNQTVNGNFAQNQFTLGTSVVGQGSISKSPDQTTYAPGQVVTLSTTPSAGWSFSSWSGACTGNGACAVTINGNTSVTATFVPVEYTLTVNVTGSGTVVKNPNQATYHFGDVVQLTQTSATGWSFSGWSGACSGSNGCSVTIDGNKTVAATFTQNTYTLTTTLVGNGTVNRNNPGPYHYGDVVQLTVVPDPGWRFVSWGGDLSGSTSPISITIDGNKSVTANFTQIEYILTINFVGNGTVSRDINPPYHYHDVVYLTPQPDAGWSFSSWSGDCTGSGVCMLNMITNKTVTVTFTQNHYTLGTNVVGQGTISKNPDQATYTYGQQVTVTANPALGWSFASWSGACTGSGACVVQMNDNNNVTATFTQNQYVLNVHVAGQGTVTKSPDQVTYTYGQQVTLTATPIAAWQLVAWSGDLSGSNNPATFTIQGNMDITATFAAIPCYVPTLIAAINAGNSSGQQITINLDTGCTYNLTGAAAADPDGYGPVGLPPISGNITIHGNGSTITRNASSSFRLLYVTQTGHLSMDNLTLSNGLAQGGNGGNAYYDGGGGGAGMGGAIFNRGTLALDHVTLTGNTASGGNGGNDGPPMDTTHTGGAGGGGMGGAGQDAANSGGNGGGVNGGAGGVCPNNGSDGGIGGGGGGANPVCYNNGGNGGFGGGGGGSNTSSGGVGGYGGGGSGTQGGGSTGGFGGGNGGLWTGGAGGGLGGAIFNDGGSLTIIVSTLSRNTANGGNGTQGTGSVGGGGSGYGGAIFNHDGTLVITDPITFSNNQVIAGTGGVNGSASGADVYPVSVTCYVLTLSHTGQGTDPVASPVNSTDCAAGQYVAGETITLSGAVANAGYQINSWTGTDNDAAKTNTNILTMPAAAHTVAVNYTVITTTCYALTVSHTGQGTDPIASPANSTGCAAGQYVAGEAITLSGAVANAGYQINSWTGTNNDTAKTATNTVTMPAAAHAVAVNYTVIPPTCYTLTLSHTGQGTDPVASPANSTGCAAGQYVAGEAIMLSGAVANAGYQINSWTGTNNDAAKTNTNTVTMPAATHAVAVNYTMITSTCYALTVSHTGQGTDPIASPTNSTGCAAGQYVAGEAITLNGAVANAGYQINSWTGTNNDAAKTNTNTVTMPAVAQSVAVNYTQIEYNLTINITGGGSVTKNPNLATYHYGQQVILTAVPDSGWGFSSWAGGMCASSNPCTVTMNQNWTVSATFIQNSFTLVINTVGGGSVSKLPDQQSYLSGSSVQLTAVPAIGWSFTGWSGDLNSAANPVSVTMDNNKTITATFTRIEYTLSVALVGSGAVNLSPSQATYHYGDSVSLTAVPTAGWSFANWSGDLTGSTTPTSLTIDGNKSVTATFTQNQYTLNISVVGQGSVNKNPNQATYTYGASVQLSAIAVSGWTFVNWSGDLTGNTNPAVVTIDGNKTITATFTQNVTTLPQNLIVNQGVLREDFESMDGWSSLGSGSVAVDSTNFKVGNASLKLTTPAGGYVKIQKTVNWDFSAPNEQGNFQFWVYVYGTGEPTDFRVVMSNDASFSNFFISYYNDAYKFRYRPGWNLINLRALSWKVGAGSPSWSSPIVRVQFRFDASVVSSFSLDGLYSGVVVQPAVLITFDSTKPSLYSQAYSYMKSRNVRGTGYAVTDLVSGANRVTWAQLQEMYAAGWTIGNNTKSRTDLTTLSESAQEAALLGARQALNANGMTNVDYVSYPNGAYNANTLTAMANLGMRDGRSLVYANNVSPIVHPYEIAAKEIYNGVSLATAQGWIDNAKSRQEILVVTLYDINASPSAGGDWSISNFQALVNYCIQQGLPIITMDDLYRLQSGSITIPTAVSASTLANVGTPDAINLFDAIAQNRQQSSEPIAQAVIAQGAARVAVVVPENRRNNLLTGWELIRSFPYGFSARQAGS